MCLPISKKDPALEKELEKEREEAIKCLEAESKKPASQRRPPDYGSEKDFPLQQALAKLKGKPVKVSKTLTERKVAADRQDGADKAAERISSKPAPKPAGGKTEQRQDKTPQKDKSQDK